MSQQFADFFLGGNSPSGFYSLFKDVYNVEDGWRVFVIKGGPGTGKSTLMKKIAAEAAERGYLTERGFCSSDPQSLDAVIVPQIRTAIFDGTAPHVIEPELPGACEIIVNLGVAFDNKKLFSCAAELAEVSDACSACHRNAVRFLRCADSFSANTSLIASKAVSTEKIKRRAQKLCSTYAGPKSGKERTRLLSAVTMEGVKLFSNTLDNTCDTLISIDDKYGAPSDMLLSSVRDILISIGCEFICCRCSQSKRIEHIILPNERVGFTVCNTFHQAHSDARITHCERFLDPSVLSENSKKFSYNRRAAAHFYSLASQEMRRAKSIHDRLEEIYSSAVDFSIVNEISETVTDAFFA